MVCCLNGIKLNWQNSRPQLPVISTDRPGFSDSSSLVPSGMFQIESGFFRTQVGSQTTTSFGDLALRYGLSNQFELRIGEISYGFSPTSNQWLNPYLGFKARIIRKPIEVTLIGQSTIPMGSGQFQESSWEPTAILAWSAPSGVNSFGGNFDWIGQGSGQTQFSQLGASLWFSHPISKSTALTYELSALNQTSFQGSGSAYVSIAITHLLTNQTQLDLRIGTGMNSKKDGWLLQGGYSILFQ